MFLNSVLFNNVFEFCNCLTKISCQVSLQAAILFFLLTEKPLCTFASTSRLTAICKSQTVWPDSGLPDKVLLILSELADLACWRTQHHLIRLSKLIFESWLFAKNPKKTHEQPRDHPRKRKNYLVKSFMNTFTFCSKINFLMNNSGTEKQQNLFTKLFILNYWPRFLGSVKKRIFRQQKELQLLRNRREHKCRCCRSSLLVL